MSEHELPFQEKAEQALRRAFACYGTHKRKRGEHAMDARSRRHLTATFMACDEMRGDEHAEPFFHGVLEKFDQHGSNFLRPPPREQKPTPEPWRDAHGKVLGNPLLDQTRNDASVGCAF